MSTAWDQLTAHAAEMSKTHLKDLLADEARTAPLSVSADKFFLDYSRQQVNPTTMELLAKLAKESGVETKRQDMLSGKKINATEGRAVLHHALRAARTDTINVDGSNVVPDVYATLDRIKDFASRVRGGQFVGATGKKLTNVVSIGIGGSFLGPLMIYDSLCLNKDCIAAADGRSLRFVANVDPNDISLALAASDPETTLVVIVSKTFTTAETMLNARTARKWLLDAFGGDESKLKHHLCAASTNLKLTAEMGIADENVFGFWDWVGGRFSTWSAVGMLPLSLQFGFEIMEKFLEGGRAMDKHFETADFDKNLPMLLGMLDVWNSTFMKIETTVVLPYSECLKSFASHIQQLDMESNGKRVKMDGSEVTYPTGMMHFGAPGTNGQHSFYQLLHQGRVANHHFMGYVKSSQPIDLAGEPVSNHDELMANFFAQPDALAFGKTAEECKAEGVPDNLVGHKVFPGNRPSISLLMPEATAYTAGQLLALYEHRTAVQGWVWDINSFDQWGVELGKVLAKNVRNYFAAQRTGKADDSSFNSSTKRLLAAYASM